VGAVAVGTGERELTGAVGALITFASPLVTMIVALAVNDWLAARYPIERPGEAASERARAGSPH
jgi:hypothetical protein